MNPMDDLIPLFGIVFLFGAPVAAWVVSRVLAHNERMEMIRHGFAPPPDPRLLRQMNRAARFGWQPGQTPQAGMPGMPPPVSSSWCSMSSDYDYYPQLQLRKGIRVTFIGLALLIGLSFIGGPNHPFGPWLLGGLVPMFVGIAQVISAVLGGARLGAPMATPGAGMPPPSSGFAETAAGRPAASPPSGPAGWRPGNLPEIEKPPSPPDYR